MKITVIAVGRLKEPAARRLADDYLVRIRRFVRCEELEVRNDAALARAIPGDARVVALEVAGRSMSSRVFARRLAAWSSQGKGHTAFLIGGADGIPPEVSGAAHEQVSLSAMTLPHQLARVVLLEQIYRANTILNNTPYAREG